MKTIGYSAIKKCRLCGHRLRKLFDLGRTPVGDHYLPAKLQKKKLPLFPLQLVQCKSCGHVQLSSRVNPEYLYTNYIYRTADSLGLVRHYKKYCAEVIGNLRLAPGSKVLEIGSNDGSLLREFKKKNMQVLGIDPAKQIAKEANKKGVPTWNLFFNKTTAEKIKNKKENFDLVIANNVLANVPDLKEFFEAVKIVLKPSGFFVFETGYVKYLAENILFDNIYHEHIDYFAIRPTRKALKLYDLRLVDCVENNSKGASIRCFAQKTPSEKKETKRLRDLCKHEKKKKYQTSMPYKRMFKKITILSDNLRRELLRRSKGGERLMGFGASVGVTTMLYFFKIGRMLSGLLDDNKNRWGLVSPGLKLNVASPKQIQKPTSVIILAWRYEKSILAKHHKNQNLNLIKLRKL